MRRAAAGCKQDIQSKSARLEADAVSACNHSFATAHTAGRGKTCTTNMAREGNYMLSYNITPAFLEAAELTALGSLLQGADHLTSWACKAKNHDNTGKQARRETYLTRTWC